MSIQSTQESQTKDSSQTNESKNSHTDESTSTSTKEQKDKKKKAAQPKWYEGKNKEIVIYYLIAVFFLEIIVGTAAFFYGVAHAEVQVEGGPKLAAFPWVGWSISATLVPVVLLLLFHLSGWFFTRTLPNEGSGGDTGGGNASSSAEIPKNVEVFYSVVSNAPVIVILLGLIALGGVLFFLDTALGTLRPYIPWILGSATAFLVICYLARLFFLARHHRMQEEYAYRMEIFKQTGVIITDKNSVPITAEQIAQATALPDSSIALPEGKSGEIDDEIVDATVVQENMKDNPDAGPADADLSDRNQEEPGETDSEISGRRDRKKQYRSSKKVSRHVKGRMV